MVGHWKSTETAFVKFEVTTSWKSRYQAWKFQVSPIATAESGGGMFVTSRVKLNVPDGPEFWAWAMKRPMVPKMQRLPALPPGLGMKDWVWDARK